MTDGEHMTAATQYAGGKKAAASPTGATETDDREARRAEAHEI
jgi:hypothetical protein